MIEIKKTLETLQVYIHSPMSRDHARVAKMAKECLLHPVESQLYHVLRPRRET